MKMLVTITAEYEVTDDLAERQRVYDTTDPAECGRVDSRNPPEEILSLAEITSFTIVPKGE